MNCCNIFFFEGDFFLKKMRGRFFVLPGGSLLIDRGMFFSQTLTCPQSTKTRPLEQPQRLEVTQKLPVLQLPPAIINHQMGLTCTLAFFYPD